MNDPLKPVIRLVGLDHPDAVERQFSTFLVDFAYVVGTTSTAADISLDVGTTRDTSQTIGPNRSW